MSGSMDDVVMKLPLRLTPRKLGAVLKSGFFIFFFGFSVFWTIMAATGVMSGGMEGEPFPGFRYAFPAFGIPFMLIGLVGLSGAVTKLLPGSPYHHVEISTRSIKVRRGFKLQQFTWPEISPFGVSVKTRSTKGGKVSTYWVVALRAGDEHFLAAEKDRYNRSILQINAGDYVNEKAEEAAGAMADWLNGIRAEAIDRPGRAIATTAVPPDFRGAVRELAAAQGVQPAPAKRSSVIER